VTSFAGGLPSPATFPIERIRWACTKVLDETPQASLQYGPTEGYTPLREWVAARLSRNGATIRASQVLITTGSQQALDLLGKVLIDEGSKVLVETPSYLGALQAFSLFQPAYSSMQSDEDGIVTDALTPGQLAGARFMYCLPNFQNPTGRRMPLERRKALLEKAIAAGVPVVEDDPYGARRRAAQPAVDGARTRHLHGLVLQGAGPGLAPGLRGRTGRIAGQAGPGQAGRRPAHAFVHPAHRP
jgi:2-aminoadipate transaminase